MIGSDQLRCEQVCHDIRLPLERWRDVVLDLVLYWDGTSLLPRPSANADPTFIKKARIEVDIGMWQTAAEEEQWSGQPLVTARRQLPDGQIVDGTIQVMQAGVWALTADTSGTDIHGVLEWRPGLGGTAASITQLGKIGGKRSDRALLQTWHVLQELNEALAQSPTTGRPRTWDSVEDFTTALDKAIAKLRQEGVKIGLRRLAEVMDASEETVKNYCASNRIDWQERVVTLGGSARKRRTR